MKLRPALAAVTAVVLLTLSGCTTSEPAASDPMVENIVDPPDTGPNPASEDDTAPGPDTLDGHTRDTFSLTWAISSDAQRDAYCMSVTFLTPEQAAAEMQQGAGGDDSLDWLLMVELLQAECALR